MGKKLNEFYVQLLSLGSMTADKEGFISGSLGGVGKETPVTIKGKRLVLPKKHQLANSDWSDRIVFHPMYENVLREESKVLEKYRSLVNMRINFTIGVVAVALLQLASSTAEHSKLNPDQTEFLTRVKAIDEKALATFKKILESIEPSASKESFVSIYLKRAGSVAGKKFARAGIVTFPFYSRLNDETVYGQKVRAKDREIMKSVMEYIYPDIATEHHYNCGSDSNVAPYMEAFLKTVLGLIAPLNDIIMLFKNVIPDLEDMAFSSDWVEMLDNLDGLLPEIRMIPMQPGNEGAVVKPASEPAATAPVTAAPVVAAVTAAPVVQPVQSPYNFMPANPAFATPVVQPAQVVRTKDGVDFNSLMASNPVLAMNARPMGGMAFGGGFGAAEAPPRWAQPGASAYGGTPTFGFNQQSGFNQQNFGGGFNYNPGVL